MVEQEGSDSVKPNLVLNFVTHKVAKVEDLRRRCFERNGMVQVTVGRSGCARQPCSCSTPCGYRYYPGVQRVRDLHDSDVMALLRRVHDEEDIRQFAWWTENLRKENERMRSMGLLRKQEFMLLGRIPGVLVRGLAHDFPDEFATSAGVTVDIQEKNLERVLGDLFVNRAHRSRAREAVAL